jgi:polysaccharide pyruvyl transferase WcaK-like protein
MIESFTLIGSSSGRNAGDAAILSGMMDSIDTAAGKRLRYEIPTYRPEFVWETYQNRVRSISMLPWHGTAGMLGYPTLASMLRTDCTLIFDNMLFDRQLYNPLFNFMSTMRLFLPIAKRQGKLLGCYNIGAGPVMTPRGRAMLGEIGQMMDFLTVRDQESFDLMRELGVATPMIITADAALSVAQSPASRVDEIMQGLGLHQEPEILGINVNAYLNSWTEEAREPLTPDAFADVYARALDRIADKIGVPLLFICTQHHDITITQKVMTRMKSKIRKTIVTNEKYSHHDIKGVFSRISLLFAMRLHASILCSSSGTPVSGLAFQKKVTSYYKLLGIPEAAMSFKAFGEDAIVGHVTQQWEARAKTRSILAKRIPELIREADRAAYALQRIRLGDTPTVALQSAAALNLSVAA